MNGVSIDAATWERVARVVRWVERHMDLAAPATGAVSAYETVFARVTSGTPDGSGNHPATITAYENGSWVDYGTVDLRPPNGEALVSGTRYAASPSGEAGSDLLYIAHGAGGITVEDDDSSPSYAGTTILRFDQDDGFSLSQPSAGVVKVDFSGGSSLTSSTQALGSPYSLTPNVGTENVLSISIPSAGTYLLIADGWATLYGDGATGHFIDFLLSVGSSGTRRICATYAGEDDVAESVCLHTIYTAGSSGTAYLQAGCTQAESATVSSATVEDARLSYVKIA